MAIALRVSTNGQTTANQELELRAWAERAGHAVVEVYADNGPCSSKCLSEWVKTGLACARAQGKRLGRPKVPARAEADIHPLRAESLGIKTVARRVGCGVGMVQRVAGAPPA